MGTEPLPKELWWKYQIAIPQWRQIVCAAQSRSGTGSICQLFAKLGIPSFHEMPWDNYETGFYAMRFVLARYGTAFLLDNVGIFLCAYKLECEVPNIRFFILIRDPVEVCNSLRYHLKKKINPNYTDDINHYYDGWLYSHQILADQIEIMQHKPMFIDFEKYKKGEYNRLFLKIYGIPETEELLMQMDNHLRAKINTIGKYEITPMEKIKHEKCMAIWRRLEYLCENSWVKDEMSLL